MRLENREKKERNRGWKIEKKRFENREKRETGKREIEKKETGK